MSFPTLVGTTNFDGCINDWVLITAHTLNSVCIYNSSLLLVNKLQWGRDLWVIYTIVLLALNTVPALNKLKMSATLKVR